jgi:L-ornithine N5-oxygenase
MRNHALQSPTPGPSHDPWDAWNRVCTPRPRPSIGNTSALIEGPRRILLDRTDIQNNPLRDLVTPRNPRSPYTFINYLHCHDRLFDFLNLGVQFPLRKDFAKYVSWVASHFTSLVRFGGEVTSIQSASTESGKPTYRIRTATGALYHAPTLVVAPGRTPNIPGAFESLLGPRVFHLTEYRARMDALLSRPIPSLRSARQIASPILPGRWMGDPVP